jgi:hypothetical protein
MPFDPRKTLILGVYFDTNVMRKAGYLLSSPWVQQLCALACDLGIGLYLPRLVVEEWVFDICQKGLEALSQLRKNRDELNRWIGQEVIVLEHPSESEVVRALKTSYSSRLVAAGFQTIENATPDLQMLLTRAVEKVPPFQAGDKGFRDAVIVESILAHAAANHAAERVIVASEDAAFCKGVSALAQAALNIQTCDVGALNKTIEESLDETLQQLREHEAAVALEFLNDNRPIIFEHVHHCRISAWMLKLGRNELDPLWNATIKRVNSVEPQDIRNALPRHGFLAQPAGTKNIPILFSVVLSLNLTVSPVNPARLFGGPTIPLAAPAEVPETYFNDPKLPFVVESGITIEHELSLRATATRTDDAAHPLGDLRIVEDWDVPAAPTMPVAG